MNRLRKLTDLPKQNTWPVSVDLHSERNSKAPERDPVFGKEVKKNREVGSKLVKVGGRSEERWESLVELQKN